MTENRSDLHLIFFWSDLSHCCCESPSHTPQTDSPHVRQVLREVGGGNGVISYEQFCTYLRKAWQCTQAKGKILKAMNGNQIEICFGTPPQANQTKNGRFASPFVKTEYFDEFCFFFSEKKKNKEFHNNNNFMKITVVNSPCFSKRNIPNSENSLSFFCSRTDL